MKLVPEKVDSEGFLRHRVDANAYMTYHTILRDSKDYYEALDSALKLGDRVTNILNDKITKMNLEISTEVFPYR